MSIIYKIYLKIPSKCLHLSEIKTSLFNNRLLSYFILIVTYLRRIEPYVNYKQIGSIPKKLK